MHSPQKEQKELEYSTDRGGEWSSGQLLYPPHPLCVC